MKHCNKCKTDKPEVEFYVDRGTPRAICKDCTRAKRKKYYRANRKACLSYMKEYVARPEVAERRAAWSLARSRTPEFRKKVREWDKTEAGQESRRRRVNRYEKTPQGIEARKRKQANRRAAGRLEGKLTADEWNEILSADGFACHYCRTPFTKENPATQDHIQPVSKGGKHVKANIVAACRKCNSSKHNKELGTWTGRKS